jgi:TIR domain
MASSERVPFDVALLRTVIYDCQHGRLSADSAMRFRSALAERIKHGLSNEGNIDSPLFMLFDQFPGIELPASSEGVEVFLSYARED